MKITKKLRIVLRENKFLLKYVRPFVVWLLDDLLKRRQKLLLKYGYEAVAIVHEVAKDINITYYADCGTLLGFIRENGFIRHDIDLDFSMLNAGKEIKSFFYALEERGFYFERYVLFDGKLREFSMRYNEISIDFFNRRITDDGKNLLVITEKVGDFWPTFLRPLPKDFKEFLIHGVKTIIPGNYEELLSSEYGEWRIPVRNWADSMAPKYTKDYSKHKNIYIRDRAEWIKFIEEMSD